MTATVDVPERLFDLGGPDAAEDAGGGLRRWILTGRKMQIIRYEFPAGAVLRDHQHPQEQALVVTRGRLLFTVDGRDHVLEPGQAIVIPPHVNHSSRVLSDDPVETIVTLGPVED